jgi:RHS repeat-associated protein
VTAIKSGGTTLASYSYDTGGRLVSRTLGNGVTTSYAYDGANQVTNITVNNGATNLWAESYAYNEAGRRISTTRSNSSDSYQYDDTYQLTGASYGTGSNASSASWSYDASGNRTQALSTNGTNTLGISYSVNEINQYTSVGEASPSYNSRGDLTGINGWAFSYDAFGNLSSAQYGTNAAYHYARDPLGRRAIRQSGSNTVLLLNAGDTMLEAYNASNNSASSYIYEPGIDKPLAQVYSDGSMRYVHQDVLGSVVMLTDSNGATYQSYSYDAWGKVTARDASGSVIVSSAISAPWLFTGRRFDKESGLYHYRARTYSAELGRFLQMDPIKFDAGDPNIFRYVGNDPLNWRDPKGQSALGVVAFVAGVAAGASQGSVNVQAQFLSPEDINAASAGNQSAINHLQDVINSGGNIQIYDGSVKRAGTMGANFNGGCGQQARNLFESLRNVSGYPSAANELGARLANGILGDNDAYATPDQRVAVAKALLDRQEAFQRFLNNRGYNPF